MIWGTGEVELPPQPDEQWTVSPHLLCQLLREREEALVLLEEVLPILVAHEHDVLVAKVQALLERR